MSAAQPVTTVPFEESIYAASGRLRTALRTAGLAVNVGEPHGTPGGDRLRLGDADEATVYALADLLADDGVPDLTGRLFAGITGASDKLGVVARAAAVDLFPGPPQARRDGRPGIPLGEINHTTTSRLADLLEEGLAELYASERALRHALLSVGIAAPQLTADNGGIVPGGITVPDADALLSALQPHAHPPLTDPDDQHAGEALASAIRQDQLIRRYSPTDLASASAHSG